MRAVPCSHRGGKATRIAGVALAPGAGPLCSCHVMRSQPPLLRYGPCAGRRLIGMALVKTFIRARHSNVPTADVLHVIGVGRASPLAPSVVKAWLRAEALLDSRPG